jgi:hypothetical protein
VSLKKGEQSTQTTGRTGLLFTAISKLKSIISLEQCCDNVPFEVLHPMHLKI